MKTIRLKKVNCIEKNHIKVYELNRLISLNPCGYAIIHKPHFAQFLMENAKWLKTKRK